MKCKGGQGRGSLVQVQPAQAGDCQGQRPPSLCIIPACPCCPCRALCQRYLFSFKIPKQKLKLKTLLMLQDIVSAFPSQVNLATFIPKVRPAPLRCIPVTHAAMPGADPGALSVFKGCSGFPKVRPSLVYATSLLPTRPCQGHAKIQQF